MQTIKESEVSPWSALFVHAVMWFVRLLWICTVIMLVSVLLYFPNFEAPETVNDFVRAIMAYMVAILLAAGLIWADVRLFRWNKGHVARMAPATRQRLSHTYETFLTRIANVLIYLGGAYILYWAAKHFFKGFVSGLSGN
jgi:hypothetical protein